jgi:hypothetical protein
MAHPVYKSNLFSLLVQGVVISRGGGGVSWTVLFVSGNHKHWLINYSGESWLLLNIGSVHAQWTQGSKFRAKGTKILLSSSRLRGYYRFWYYRLFWYLLLTPTWLACKNWRELYEMCICFKLADDEAVWRMKYMQLMFQIYFTSQRRINASWKVLFF